MSDGEMFGDSIADYLATRVKPWENEAEMREAVHEALRLTFTEALDDPKHPLSRRESPVPASFGEPFCNCGSSPPTQAEHPSRHWTSCPASPTSVRRAMLGMEP